MNLRPSLGFFIKNKAIVRYVSPKEASDILGVNERTLRGWEESGKIQAIRTPSGQRRYNVDQYASGARTTDNRSQTYLHIF
ncbi:MAG: helix-turn-helix domain-containing protein [Brasilonema angustatum HA4187-MV1]|nr:helix-turn-helix domain-containing protein [Brasilonema angustatum HA4187-MV1]